VAKMVHTLFLSILGNKKMEERLQKAAGKRHKKLRLDTSGHAAAPVESPPKTEFGEMTLGYPTGPPAPQVSFERSRPQTPAMASPSNGGDPAQQQNLNVNVSPNHNNGSTQMRDTFLSSTHSRSGTRPPTPFNPSYSIPATPPDMYLVTRNSPTISQSLWENFQPEQLFPDSTNLHFGTQFGGVDGQGQQNLDPALQMPQMQGTPGMPGVQPQHLQSPTVSMTGMSQDQWGSHLSPEDTWSNSSRSAAAVPSTLNVEDWYVGSTISAIHETNANVAGSSSLAWTRAISALCRTKQHYKATYFKSAKMHRAHLPRSASGSASALRVILC
jgi:hypothetical protein